MNPIKFSSIVEYLKSLWKEAVSYCQANYQDFKQDYLESNGLPAKDFFQVDFFVDDGTISGAIINNPDNLVRPICVGKCIVSHSNGSQDSSLQVDMYAQSISLEMISPEIYRSEMTMIWEKFTNNLKSQIATIDSTSCIFKTDELSTFEAKKSNLIIEMPTVECYKTTLNTVMVAFLGVILSNNCTLSANLIDVDGIVQNSNEEDITGSIYFIDMTYSDVIETRSRSKTEVTHRFQGNTRQVGLTIRCIATASILDTAIRNDIESGTYFGKYLQLTKTLGDEVKVETYVRTTGKVSYAFGSAVIMEFLLQPTFF